MSVSTVHLHVCCCVYLLKLSPIIKHRKLGKNAQKSHVFFCFFLSLGILGLARQVHTFENYAPSWIHQRFCHRCSVILCMGPLLVCPKYLELLCFNMHVLLCGCLPYGSDVEFTCILWVAFRCTKWQAYTFDQFRSDAGLCSFDCICYWFLAFLTCFWCF